jgi:hypothetical protein
MFKSITKLEALQKWEEWNANDHKLGDLSDSEKKFRTDIKKIYDRHSGLLPKKAFEFDVRFGEELHLLFQAKGLSSLRYMADDGFWRYLSVVIAPDIVAARHGYKEEYYFSRPGRVWFRCIWWLIHLSWQETYNNTTETLLSGKFSTDSTVAICERTGQDGINVELYRAIVRKISQIDKFDSKEIRRVMKLNTVKSSVVEPALTKDGLNGYVNRLFTDLGIR